jgi:hypothetical protein
MGKVMPEWGFEANKCCGFKGLMIVTVKSTLFSVSHGDCLSSFTSATGIPLSYTCYGQGILDALPYCPKKKGILTCIKALILVALGISRSDKNRTLGLSVVNRRRFF